MIVRLTRRLVARYGINEVRQWPFEVWNEPDTNAFWAHDQEAYFRPYAETARAARDAASEVSVGGPATCPTGIHWITPFLERCARDRIPVDFVSTHSYYGAALQSQGEYDYQELHPVEYALNQFREARERFRSSTHPGLPLHITEYSTSWSPRSPVHDTAFNAASLGCLLSRGCDGADSFSYWTFSVVFEECDVPRSFLHGGFGLLAAHRIRKPTYHQSAFFGRLGREHLHRDEHMVVTRRDDGTITAFLWNPAVGPEEGQALTCRFSGPFAGMKRRWPSGQ